MGKAPGALGTRTATIHKFMGEKIDPSSRETRRSHSREAPRTN